ncbi:MAG: phosphonatase-like hydrolase [Isosphaeraceae bacterium]
MSPIELVAFDIAGTTVEDPGVVNRCLRDALAAAGLSLGAAEVNRVMGLPKPLALARLIDGAGRSRDLGEQVEAIHRDFVARALAFYREDPSVREVAGAGELFRSLRAAGLRVALDTGFDRPITDAILRRLGWAEGTAVDAAITSDEVERGRPHPDMILALMRRLGIESPLRVAKIGDTPSDLEEGTNAGCGLVVGVTGGTHSREQLEPFPHTHLIASIRELPAILGLSV